MKDLSKHFIKEDIRVMHRPGRKSSTLVSISHQKTQTQVMLYQRSLQRAAQTHAHHKDNNRQVASVSTRTRRKQSADMVLAEMNVVQTAQTHLVLCCGCLFCFSFKLNVNLLEVQKFHWEKTVQNE